MSRFAWMIIAGSALSAAALAFGCGPDWDALDPSLGSSSGSTGGAGGTGGGTTNSTSSTSAGCPSLDDGKECTQDACVNSVAQHTPIAAGLACSQGGNVCDGKGACVGCLAPADCPGADTPCAKRACDGTTCGTDLVTAGAPCSENGGTKCDGKGSCVACLADADCGTTTACAVYTCTAGACPAAPNLAPGTPCGASAVCDGGGACVTCQGTSTQSFTSANVPQTAASNGTAISTLAVTGAAGSVVRVAVTVDVGGAQARAGDLSLTLTSPLGTKIDLSSNNGGASVGGFAGTTFDDRAAVRVLYATFTSGTALASAIPERNLSKLMGEDPNGTWQLQVDNAGALGAATLNAWSLAITTQAANPALTAKVFGNTISQSIPHGATTTSTITASGLGLAIYKATVKVEVPHPKSGQIALSLTSPSGKVISLAKNIGGNTPDVFASTTFDDDAALLLGCTGAGCASPTATLGSAVPQGALSALVGDDPNGTWTLSIADNGMGPTGTLQGWSLSLTPALCAMAP